MDYKDFSFWKLQVERVRYIGGYGRMSWVSRDDWFAAEPDPIAPYAQSIMDHMNKDHATRMVDYCTGLTKAKDTTAATMTAVDRYGFEMSAITSKGPRLIRLAFSRLIATPAEARGPKSHREKPEKSFGGAAGGGDLTPAGPGATPPPLVHVRRAA